jgi:hypothetical protein
LILLQSITQPHLAGASQPAGSSLRLWFPSALEESKVHVRGFTSPARFRLQGLGTLVAVFSLRFPAGFVSHRRRSWDSPFGAFSSRKVSVRFRPEAPTYRFASRYTRCRSIRPARQATVPGFYPFRKSLATRMCLAREPLVAPLGFTLPGFPARALAGFRPASSHVVEPFGSPPWSIDQLLPGPIRFSAASRRRRMNRPS